VFGKPLGTLDTKKAEKKTEVDITTNLRGKECKGKWQMKGSSTSQAVTKSN